ncbi:MAG: BadF/BadG/BcrA/BcrD ATPase family protein, partial [Arachnia sp.]
SGYALGSDALAAVAAAADGTGAPTALTDDVLAELDLAEPAALVDWAYRDLSWSRFAAIAPLAIQAAARGDAVAGKIVENNAQALADSVSTVAYRLHLRDAPVVLGGSLVQPGPYRDRVTAKIARGCPDASVTHPPVDAATGAAWLALAKEQTWR